MPSPFRSSSAALSKHNVARWVCSAGGGALLMTGLLAGTSSAATAPVTLKAAADSWVDAGQPTVNRGTAGYLQVDASPVLRGYVRFTVPVPAGEQLTRAVLSLTPNQSNSSGIAVRTASSSWTETGLTYANAPAPSSTVRARSGALTAGVPVQLDVTSAVPATGGPVTLVLENLSGTSFSLRSREQATGAPTLQVSTAATTTSTTTTVTAPTATTSPTPTTTTSPTPAPTTTTAPTTTAPTTTAPTTTTSNKLTWAPPALTNPKTYHVSGDGPGTITAAAGQDSIVVFDGPVNRRIRMSGGRHWVIRGGEIDNNKQWASIDDQSGLQFENATGTAFVEGMLIHGAYGKDGIRVGRGGSNITLVVQNTRILQRMAGPTGYHADVLQPYGGVKALKVDRLTGGGDYQGQMWKQESGTTFGPTDFRRVNYRAANPQVQYMINFVMSAPTQPVTLTEVYNQPDPNFIGGDWCRTQVPSSGKTCSTDSTGRKIASWAGTPITVHGHVKQGAPAGGDFVPAGVAGLGYVSPGYL